MKQDNTTLTTREKALEWWGGLTIQRQTFMAAQHKPEWHFEMVASSSSTIERMYLSQHPEQPAKEDEELRRAYQVADFEANARLIANAPELAKENQALRESNERLKEALENMEGMFNTPLVRRAMKEVFSDMHQEAINSAKEALNNK